MPEVSFTLLQGVANPLSVQRAHRPTQHGMVQHSGALLEAASSSEHPTQLSPCSWDSHETPRSCWLLWRDAQAPVCGRQVGDIPCWEPCSRGLCSTAPAGCLGPGGNEQWEALGRAGCGTGAGNGQPRKDWEELAKSLSQSTEIGAGWGTELLLCL